MEYRKISFHRRAGGLPIDGKFSHRRAGGLFIEEQKFIDIAKGFLCRPTKVALHIVSVCKL